MIERLNPKQTIVHFGKGTVSMKPIVGKHAGIIDLGQCNKRKIGSEIPDIIKVKAQVRLRFQNTESIDALITKLEDIKSLMIEEASNG